MHTPHHLLQLHLFWWLADGDLSYIIQCLPHRRTLFVFDLSTTSDLAGNQLFLKPKAQRAAISANMGFVHKVAGHVINLFVFSWDFGLFILNILTPSLKPGHVVPSKAAGHNLTWPEYVPPTETDSRSACPMLNAMANHGILPHDGKNISFRDLNVKVRHTFNFASSFCFFVPKFAADFLNRSYWSGHFDLAELSLHNAIEHDGSLTRHDAALVADQGKPDLKLVDDLLKEASGTMPDGSPRLTIPDLSRALSKRRLDARKTNKEYTENFFHNFFGSSKFVPLLIP
jgi:hypothetical protein